MSVIVMIMCNLPYPAMPYSNLPHPTLPHPTVTYPTLLHPTLPHSTLPHPVEVTRQRPTNAVPTSVLVKNVTLSLPGVVWLHASGGVDWVVPGGELQLQVGGGRRFR